MKISRAMIGDWVYKKAKNGVAIPIQVMMRDYVELVSPNGYDLYEWSPVKLTPKILMMSGFKERIEGLFVCDKDETFMLTYDGGRFFVWLGAKKRVVMYVHELQQLLRFAMLKGVANKFKVG